MAARGSVDQFVIRSSVFRTTRSFTPHCRKVAVEPTSRTPRSGWPSRRHAPRVRAERPPGR